MNIHDLRKKVEDNLNLSLLPESARNEVIALLGENILKRVSLAIMEKLSPLERSKFENLAEKDISMAQEYAAKSIPDFHEFVEGEIKDEIETFKRRSSLS